ncbi:hypothetical protein NQZ68_032551 [Dissostichus eleginoides]|nr:hypothetical protein NQZ68_032551 [Dissostichus eleginoides]
MLQGRDVGKTHRQYRLLTAHSFTLLGKEVLNVQLMSWQPFRKLYFLHRWMEECGGRFARARNATSPRDPASSPGCYYRSPPASVRKK